MDYSYRDYYMWDTWYIYWEGKTHLFGIQRQREGRCADTVGGISHIVSEDLLDWEALPDALAPGQPGDIDDMALWTGCVIEHENKFYMYYTGRNSSTTTHWNWQGGQSICLATSDDLVKWKKYENNPVIKADPRWYFPNDCRDLAIVRDDKSEWFYGFFAAGKKDGKGGQRGVIALCRSKNLIEWEQLPPAFEPDKYKVIEVPDVFYMNGRYYMLMLTGTTYGRRETFSDPDIKHGVAYAVSDNLEGPYTELDNNILLGNNEPWHAFSARTVMINGSRLLFYTQAERTGRQDGIHFDFNWGRLTTPKILRTKEDGKLQACYNNIIETKVKEVVLDNVPSLIEQRFSHYRWSNWSIQGEAIYGEYDAGYDTYTFLKENPKGFIYSAKLSMLQGRAAGLVFHNTITNSDDGYFNGMGVFLDFDRQEIVFTNLSDFHFTEKRKIDLVRNTEYHLVIVARGEFYEVYLDDVLWIQLVRYTPDQGNFGLYIEDGKAVFHDVVAKEIDLCRQN